jgi:hypothetical protein
MRILMTGFTPRGVGSTKLLYEYMSNTAVIKKVLEMAGHEIDHRIVDVDEPDLPQKYDVAMVAVAVPQSLSSRYVYGALWAAEQFGVERTRLFVDDWLLHQFQSQLESGLKNPEKRFYSLDNRHCFKAAQKYTDTWIKWFKFLSRSRYNLLLPCFGGWARPRRLLPRLDNVQPIIFDPTPLAWTDPEVFWGVKDDHTKLQPKPMSERKREWVLAAMRDVSHWYKDQSFSWPVRQFGNKRQKHEIVTERELVIGAPYELVSGGGGWRARYIHAAYTNSILFLDPEEGKAAGEPYNLFRSIVEKSSNDELEAIALRQREHLLKNTWSLDELVSNLDTYVRV